MAGPDNMSGQDNEVHVDDFEDPEDFAEAVGIDPTAEQVDEYRAETGQRPAGPDDPILADDDNQ